MTDRVHHKASNRENKSNDVNRPVGNKKNKKNPPKFENFEGTPMQ